MSLLRLYTLLAYSLNKTSTTRWSLRRIVPLFHYFKIFQFSSEYVKEENIHHCCFDIIGPLQLDASFASIALIFPGKSGPPGPRGEPGADGKIGETGVQGIQVFSYASHFFSPTPQPELCSIIVCVTFCSTFAQAFAPNCICEIPCLSKR